MENNQNLDIEILKEESRNIDEIIMLMMKILRWGVFIEYVAGLIPLHNAILFFHGR